METVALFLLMPLLIWGTKKLLGQELEWRGRVKRDWREVGKALGLEVSAADSVLRLQGPLAGADVQAELRERRRRDGFSLRSRVVARCAGLPGQLQARADARVFARGPAESDVAIGDPRFDEQVQLGSLDAAACAALSQAARQALPRLFRWGARVEQGQVICEAEWALERDAATLREVLSKSAELATLLGVPVEALHQRLIQNALEDPEPGVRLRNLRFLVAAETQVPVELLQSTARALLADVHPIRLLAAQQLGAEGHAVLRALAADAGVQLAQRVAAVTSLGQGAPDVDGLWALLEARHPPEVVCAALSALAATARDSGRGPDAVVACTHSEHEAVRTAAAATLGALAQPAAEPALLRLLGDASKEVQLASVEALGATGGVTAVEPLLQLSEGLVPTLVQRAARAAIRRIQARLGPVEAGRLSLAGATELAGAVALVATRVEPAGALSLAQEQGSSEADAQRTPLKPVLVR